MLAQGWNWSLQDVSRSKVVDSCFRRIIYVTVVWSIVRNLYVFMSSLTDVLTMNCYCIWVKSLFFFFFFLFHIKNNSIWLNNDIISIFGWTINSLNSTMLVSSQSVPTEKCILVISCVIKLCWEYRILMSISLISQTPLGCNLLLMSLVLHVYIGLLNQDKNTWWMVKIHFWIAKLLVNVGPPSKPCWAVTVHWRIHPAWLWNSCYFRNHIAQSNFLQHSEFLSCFAEKYQKKKKKLNVL